MSPVTLPSSRTLLLCACAERPRPSYSFFFFRFRCQPEMPPDAGHGKRESAPATIPGCHVWPVFQPSCPAVANRSNGRQDHFQTDAAGGTPVDRKPCPHDNDGHGTSVTAAGKRGFPLSVAPPFRFSCGALRHFTYFPLSFPSLQVYANVPMPPFQTASVVIFVAGAKVKTGLGTQIF